MPFMFRMFSDRHRNAQHKTITNFSDNIDFVFLYCFASVFSPETNTICINEA